MVMCILPFHHVNVANPSPILRISVPASCWVGNENSTIVARPEEKYPDSRPMLGALPKVNIRLMFHPAGLQGLYTVQLDKIDTCQN